MNANWIAVVCICWLAAACVPSGRISDHPAGTATEKPVRHSLVFIIHGDASYLYHDSDGNARNADREALKDAFHVAENLPAAEVFIFHQKPASRLFFIPRPESRFYYFRNGTEMVSETYFMKRNGKGMESEAALYHRYRYQKSNDKAMDRIFLYFGHEIPANPDIPYHHSTPRKTFHINKLAKGLKQFNNRSTIPADPSGGGNSDSEAGVFDLIVLSTCRNGNPEAIKALEGQSRYLLASPENLHLSYIDSRYLTGLGKQSGNISEDFMIYFAENAFQNLAVNLYTTITLTLFNISAYHSGHAEGITEAFHREALFGRRNR